MPVIILIVSALLAHARVAQAQPHDITRFSERGRIMLDGVIGGRWSNTPARSPRTQRPPWEVYVQPRVTYFFADRMGLGLAVGGSFAQRNEPIRYSSAGDWTAKTRDYELWAGPDATLDLPIVDKVSLLVLPGVYYMRAFRRLDQREYRGSAGRDGVPPVSSLDVLEHDAHFMRFSLRLPLVFHVSSSVALGLGPTVWWDLFLSQDPPTKDVAPVLSPNGGFQFKTDPYPRTRLILGFSAWLGGSF